MSQDKKASSLRNHEFFSFSQHLFRLLIQKSIVSTVGSNGHLPDEIGLLSPSLIDFYWMREDQIDGTIPDAWTMLTSLERFNLGNLNMSGTWPATLFKNTPLINLTYLHYNEFTGPISTEIGLLKELRIFLIRGNNFNDTLPMGVQFYTS